MSGAGKAWNDRAFFYGISIGCIPPETKCEILAHKGSQTTGTTTRDYAAPWNRTPLWRNIPFKIQSNINSEILRDNDGMLRHTPVEQRTGQRDLLLSFP